jgi:nitrogen fixation protein FixH
MKPRDLMAPDTEPTDEELALVMREARELAAERRLKSDAWVAARIEEAGRFARENARPRRSRGQK